MKTAVESIIEKIQKRIDRQLPYIEKYNTPDCRLYLYKILEECMEALEMEKEQIINAHLTGLIYPLEMEATKQATEYYSETYKKPEPDGK